MSRRLTSAALTAALAMATLAASVTAAQEPAGPYFSAQLALPTTQGQAIAGGVLFKCEGSTCNGPRSGDRPLRVCSELRRKVGTISSFAANGEALSADDLARCNG